MRRSREAPYTTFQQLLEEYVDGRLPGMTEDVVEVKALEKLYRRWLKGTFPSWMPCFSL